MTDLDTACMRLVVQKKYKQAVAKRNADLLADIERQRLASIARLEADEPAFHLRHPNSDNETVLAAGMVCTIAGVALAIKYVGIPLIIWIGV